MMDSTRTTNRVMLWTVGRSLSTVFLKCMSNVKGIQILNEPYYAACELGPESVIAEQHQDYTSAFTNYKATENTIYETNLKMAVDDNVCTFDWAKEALEVDYPGKDIVFCKDIVDAIVGRYGKLPKGFRHTYLIRHPHKVFLSWKKFAANVQEVPYESVILNGDLHPTLHPSNSSYGKLYDLMMFFKTRGDEPSPIVIDSDDLQQDPDSIISQYCRALGIPYDKSLLQWPSGVEAFNNWISAKSSLVTSIKPGGHQQRCAESTSFAPPSATPSREQLTDDILAQVDNVWYWYQEMYALRLRP